MPDLVQTADDLKTMPDSWLAQQAQNPGGMVPPWLVMSEIARRQKLRSGEAQAQAPQSSVAQDMIRSLFARIPPASGPQAQQAGPNAPPGMTPVNLNPGAGSFGPPPGTPPANLRMPRTMADGGSVDGEDGEDGEDAEDAEDAEDGGDYTPVLARAPSTQQQMAGLYPPSPTGSASRSMDTDDLVNRAAAKYNVPATDIRSMMQAESNRKPRAVSPKGALGLMQLMPGTAKQYGVTDPFDEAQNIDAGTHYYADLLQKYEGNRNRALAAYNFGPGNIDKGKPLPTETENYIARINKLRQQGGTPPLDPSQPTPFTPRLLLPRENPPTANTAAPDNVAAVGSADTTGSADTADTTNTAPAAPAVAAVAPTAATVAPAVAPTPVPLGGIWKPQEPADLTEAKQREADARAEAKKLLDNMKTFDPDTVWSEDALSTARAKIQSFLGPEPDNSRWTDAMQSLMAQAQKMMHPSLSSMLVRFGLGLMASKEHYFGVAVGQAGLGAMQAQEQEQQEGKQLYLQAMNAGIHLQDRTNAYNEKVGNLMFRMQQAQQTAGESNQKEALAQYRAAEQAVTAAHRDVATAQASFDKSTQLPLATRYQIVGGLQSLGIPIDPTKPPEEQLELAAQTNPQALALYHQVFPVKGAAGTKPPPPNDQYLQSAIRKIAQDNNKPLPTDRLPVLADLPIELQEKVIGLAGEYGAQRTIAGQKGTADLFSPEAMQQAASDYLILQKPFSSRNPVLVGRFWEAVHKMAGPDQMNLPTVQRAAEISMVNANKQALGNLVKTSENVDAFSGLALKNMNLLEETARNVVDYGKPVLNAPMRELEQNWKGDPRVTAFRAALLPVQAEIARVLNSANAQGVVHQDAREEMKAALDPNASYGQLVAALNVFRREMANRRQEYADQITDLKPRTVIGQTEIHTLTPGHQFSPDDKGKIFFRNGQKVRITDINKDNPKLYKWEAVP